jgi:hypothetical protein
MKRKHVIIGGGSSGLALAKVLSACDEVAIIERGEFQLTSSSSSTSAEAWLNIYAQHNVWCFRSFVSSVAERICTAPQTDLLSRVVCYSQGNGGGGSGGVNAMIYTLGSMLVFDMHWPTAWNFKHIDTSMAKVLRYYQPYLLQTSGAVRALLSDGGATSNGPSIIDHKGYAPSYYASINASRTDRLNQSHACFGPTLPSNVTIMENCFVRRIDFDGTLAAGVVIQQCSSDGQVKEQTVRPENGGEIILCSGVFESPRILIASGLKEGTQGNCPLQSNSRLTSFSSNKAHSGPVVDIPPIPDIGSTLQDHIVVPYMLLANWYQGWDIFHSKGTAGYAGKPAYPLNGIHGWVNLTAGGEVWDEKSGKAPW